MGNKLKAVRESKGLSISRLSEMSGVSRQTIYNLESDEAYLASSRTLIKLANALGESLEDVFFTLKA